MKRFITKNNLTFEKDANQPFTGAFEEFWPSGGLLRKGQFRAGQKHGVWEKYRVK